MKKIFLLIMGLGMVFFTGCATSDYMTDRGNDAADIVTGTVASNSFGVGVRVGPMAFGGFLANENERKGLRGGEFLTDSLDEEGKGLFSFLGRMTLVALLYYGESFFTDIAENTDEDRDPRNKSFAVEPLWGFMPIAIGEEEKDYAPAYYFTQIEVMIGIVGGIRFGFNPGELIDFLLGWTTLDIYGDDVGVETE